MPRLRRCVSGETCLSAAGGDILLSDVTPEFTTSLDELRGIIVQYLSTPHIFGGTHIAGGERLHDIVGSLCDVVNSTGGICPPRLRLVR